MLCELISSTPTRIDTADQAYAAYWAVATASDNYLASGTGPVYRFAVDNMLRAIALEYRLSLSQVAWLYEEGPLAEGPGWGDVRRMVEYGREMRFGESRIANEARNCLYHDEGNHSMTCPDRDICITCGDDIYPDSSYGSGYRHREPSLHGAKTHVN